MSTKLLLLFDDKNIEIFKKTKKRLKIIGKNVDESEVWINNLDDDEKALRILDETAKDFQFFNNIIYKGNFLWKIFENFSHK